MKSAGLIVGWTLILSAALPAQTLPSRNAREAADAFRLDLGEVPADHRVVEGKEPAPEELPEAPTAQAKPEAPTRHDAEPVSANAGGTSSVAFNLDTPINVIIADPGAKAVLDRDLPGLTTDENLPKFGSLSLRAFQPMTGGQLTDALLAKAGADLAKVRPSRARKPRFDSR